MFEMEPPISGLFEDLHVKWESFIESCLIKYLGYEGDGYFLDEGTLPKSISLLSLLALAFLIFLFIISSANFLT